MAKHNPCGILTGDFNPLVGCERYSAGCRDCWFLDFIFPWQQWLGHIPPGETPDRPTFFPHRMTVEALKVKNGIVGICQHGDLFWERVDIDSIHHVLDLIDQVAQTKRVTPKYVLWTKRAERMAQVLAERYPAGVPSYFACAVSIENQHLAETRLPHLLGIEATRIAVLEPLLGPVDLGPYIDRLHWVVVGSETGKGRPRPLQLDWVRQVRDVAVSAGVPFFLKQLNGQHGEHAQRTLDSRTWDQFPRGFQK